VYGIKQIEGGVCVAACVAVCAAVCVVVCDAVCVAVYVAVYVAVCGTSGAWSEEYVLSVSDICCRV